MFLVNLNGASGSVALCRMATSSDFPLMENVRVRMRFTEVAGSCEIVVG